MADFRFEKGLLRKGYRAIAGVDEAGRGALFGPVVAASVMFDEGLITGRRPSWLREVNDSKRLTPQKRERLARAVLGTARSVGVGVVSSREIDRMNIYQASLEAMKRSIARMADPPDFVLVDGFPLEGVGCPQREIKMGDRRCLSIAAASIIAKVLRDRMMQHLDLVYEGYGFARHKGYGTPQHIKALQEKGPTDFHRFSFRPVRKD
ncbi:MAG: ribonuclease HII [Candidatus Aminicenantales bacterium]